MNGSMSSRLDRLERRLNPDEKCCKILVSIDNEDGTYNVGGLKDITEDELREYGKSYFGNAGRPVRDIMVDGEDGENGFD